MKFDARLDSLHAVPDQAPPARAGRVRLRQAALCVLPVVLVLVVVLPFGRLPIGALPSFIPAMLALVGLLDVICAVLLIGQFRHSGDRRALLLGSAYVFSLLTGAGFAASFPGVLGAHGVLGGWPSTAPWLWTAWHIGFPLLLASSVAPWPARWEVPVRQADRTRTAGTVLGLVGAAGVVMVLAAGLGRGWLPTLIHGRDTTALTRYVGPVMLPLVGVALVVALVGAGRLTGPVRWAALATTAVFGDDVLSLSALSRYSLGWYVGRVLTVFAAAVVVVAMLREFGHLRSQLAVEAGQLRLALSRSEELEALHATLLNLMSDGVLLRGADGRVMAMNPAAEALLGVSLEQLQGDLPLPPGWDLCRSDGTPVALDDAPGADTVRTGLVLRDQMMGVSVADGPRRWLRVNTTATRNTEGDGVQHVVSSLADETERHLAQLEARQEYDVTRQRVQAMLDAGGPHIHVQPIRELRTGAVVGREALARFDSTPVRGPDKWFADAATAGLAVELELSAVRNAVALLAVLPAAGYLSVNVSPATAISAGLYELLSSGVVDCARIVLELTEHSGIASYDVLRTALAPLRGLGVRIAVDDAGAGFSSMSHILNLRPDFVKLDISLVRGIHRDPARRALAEGMLIFATEIKACLIAEGIEAGEDLTALLSVGVTHGQGYYLGRPAAVGAAEAPQAGWDRGGLRVVNQ
jgi:EAL domain-containing protein (putative c-di-GMP-specific phosphodiesterase class I)/PAS domain-containing protein